MQADSAKIMRAIVASLKRGRASTRDKLEQKRLDHRIEQATNLAESSHLPEIVEAFFDAADENVTEPTCWPASWRPIC